MAHFQLGSDTGSAARSLISSLLRMYKGNSNRAKSQVCQLVEEISKSMTIYMYNFSRGVCNARITFMPNMSN